jgi:hypothetical protein
MSVNALIVLVQSCVFLFLVAVFDKVTIHNVSDVSKLYVEVWQ